MNAHGLTNIDTFAKKKILQKLQLRTGTLTLNDYMKTIMLLVITTPL